MTATLIMDEIFPGRDGYSKSTSNECWMVVAESGGLLDTLQPVLHHWYQQ